MLDVAQHIIAPLIYATIIAIVMSPLVKFFVRKGMNRVLAIALSISLVSVVLISLVVFSSYQISELSEKLPLLLEKFYETLNRGVIWASQNFHISTRKINLYIAETKTEILNSSSSSIALTLATLGDALVILLLIPVYVFMILFYEPLLLDFIRRLFGIDHRKEVNEILSSTKTIIQKYLIALLFEALIIAVLNSAGLFFIGIEYAILLGVLGALLNIIPYLGGLLAMLLYMIIALVTKNSFSYMLYVLVLYSFIQLIDNNIIVPKLVGSKVKINALVAIVAVIAGGALWGIPGMFLSLPLTAIAKLIFDRVEPLKPWGFLLGDTMPPITIFKINLKKEPVKIKEDIKVA
jgi:predicted PurR-regulated permease PerM